MRSLTDRRHSAAQREVRLFGLAFLFVLLLTVVLIMAPVVRTGSWSSVADRLSFLLILPCWLASVLWVRWMAKRQHPEREPYLLPIVYLLSGWGVLLVWRVAPAFGVRQLMWFLVASGFLGLVLGRPTILEGLRRYRILWLMGGLLLTVLTLFFGTHPSGGDQRLWLRIMGIYIQPSEPLRLLLIAYLASYFSEALPFKDVRKGMWLPSLAPLLAMWGLSVGLLLVQRDLGTATLVLAILAGLLYFASGRRVVFVAALLFTLLAGGTGYLLSDVVQIRVDTWLNPWSDPIAGGYQMIQSLIGIASGGILGQGPGLGSPGFIPAVHTDFIFAAVLEEMGAVGGLAMIALFAILVERGLRITLHQGNTFRVLLCAGLSISLGFQVLYILGGVLRLVPLAGITLPFVSYGGSSLVSSYLLVGLLAILSADQVDSQEYASPVRDFSWIFMAGWTALALVVGWWTIYRAPVLVARTDNPRRALESRYSLRGRILDRDDVVLAESSGARGDYIRSYPVDSASVVVGYDSVMYGHSGVEQSMDDVLRGVDLHDPLLVWWSYKLYGFPPEGLDVRLTVDADIQQAAVGALGERTGAAVIMEAQTGDILALASVPAFRSSTLDEDWPQLIAQLDSPLINRTTQGVYQPGMSLAPMTYIWALQQGVVRAEDTPDDPDQPVQVNGLYLECLTDPGEEDVTYLDAILAGCPAPVAALAEELGEEGLREMLTAFGLDRAPSLQLPQIAITPLEDIVPEEEAYGQGLLQVSPLQLARAWSVLAGEGILPGVRLVEALGGPHGGWILQTPIDAPRTVLEAGIASQVPAFFPTLSNGIQGYAARAISGESGETVAWFLGFDQHEPRRVVVIVLENSTPAEARSVGVALLGGLADELP